MPALPDPFELNRLAEELATRERAAGTKTRAFSIAHSDEDNEDDELTSTHSLPVFVPLSHDNPHLLAEVFDVEEFLLSRSFTSLPDLRSELRDYLVTLKEELVKLINDDYEAFISLSTDLRSEGARLERLRRPLGNLRSQVLESRRELQLIQDAIQDKLAKRATLREEKAQLHLLLKISDSVTRLESLLHIASPIESTPTSPKDNPLRISVQIGSNPEDESNVEDRMGSRAKHLGRVAAEYTQLLYHTSKARVDKCAFMDEIQWRIDRIQSTLSSDLDHLFASTLISLTSSKTDSKPTEMDKAKWTADLTECMRTYDALKLWGDAEGVLRKEIVRPFIRKTIFPGALSVPHSPIVPHTPFPGRPSQFAVSTVPGPVLTSGPPPDTPSTPFSPFASKQIYSHSRASSSSLRAHLLDDSDDHLALVYNQILRFVERDLSRMMDVGEKVSQVKVSYGHGSHGKSGEVSVQDNAHSQKTGGPKREGFEILANVVWDEAGKAIMSELGSVVFAVGRPDEFKKNYQTTQAFIRYLEFLAPSAQSVDALRAHSVYLAFDKRWQLPVYFQMRWKEIVTKVESSLAAASVMEPSTTTNKETHTFATLQAATVWSAILSCWSEEIYIPELGHRFWRLTLQLLSRYRTWLVGCLPSPTTTSGTTTDTGIGAGPNPSSRSGTPVLPPSEALSAESTAADQAQLRQCAAAVADIVAINGKTSKLWEDVIGRMLPDTPKEEDDDDKRNLGDALRRTLATLTSMLPPLSSQIIAILTRRSCDALLPVRSIPSQFRAMSNKRMPTEPSYFVSSILRPVKNFFAIETSDGPGALLKDIFLKQYATEVCENVSQRYIYYLTAMKKTEESLKRLKKGRQSAFSLFGSGSSSSGSIGNEEDEERIRVQMRLDVGLFGRDARLLGVDLNASEGFKELSEVVQLNVS